MSADPDSLGDFLPAGEASEERLWACVGHALTCWEHMESQLAWLYTIFIGEPGSLQALGEYGKENGIFKDRLQCVAHSAESYFQKRPDQDHEGEVAAIIQQSRELSVVRHRIAHASKGKCARAEPIALKFEAGKAFFAGQFPELEAELGMTAGGGYEGRSPDRADAMVWAMTVLSETRSGLPRVRRL